MLQPDLEVFRTTITCPKVAAALRAALLQGLPPGALVSFDLDDCDRVLRVQTPGRPLPVARIVTTLRESGYLCEPLPD